MEPQEHLDFESLRGYFKDTHPELSTDEMIRIGTERAFMERARRWTKANE